MTATTHKTILESAQSRTGDNTLTGALGATAFALTVGYAIHENNGYYDRLALLSLTIGLGLIALSLFLPARAAKPDIWSAILGWGLAAGIVFEASVLLSRARIEPLPIAAIVAMAVTGFLQLFAGSRLKAALILLALAAFFYAGVFAIDLPNPGIDVYDWQQQTSLALSQMQNPYEVRIAPRYPRQTGFYPPGMVDARGYLNAALPYPPLSLLMVLPGFVLGGDIRYALLCAIGASATLMAFARPGRTAALAAILFLLTPRVLYVLWNGWTEPLMVLNFSLVMFCACRWRRGLPWALGLFLATKQTTIWAVPLVPLLVEGPKLWKQLLWIGIKAGVVVTIINAPFVIWNLHQFVRAVVLLRVVPAFRTDALTYLVWIYSLTGKIPPTWIGAVVGAAAVALVLWKAPRSPAGFAAGVTLVTTLFFAFSKQAFANYYYFTIGTACWAIAAARMPRAASDEPRASSDELRAHG